MWRTSWAHRRWWEPEASVAKQVRKKAVVDIDSAPPKMKNALQVCCLAARLKGLLSLRFLSLFYIKPQLNVSSLQSFNYCILSLFYIKPQPLKRVALQRKNCILSLFYIKPQLIESTSEIGQDCILSLFYIKPQHIKLRTVHCQDCILSLFYIKPQLYL